LAGVVAVETMGGPTIPWRPGRVDKSVFERQDSGLELSEKGKFNNQNIHKIDKIYI
jgi:catalase (peroxidase I)